MPRPRTPKQPARFLPRSFVAIDFETADYPPESACSIGIVKVVDGQITHSFSRLIRPPRPYVRFTAIHGITWAMVRSQPSFGELWPELQGLLSDAPFLAAHNAGFDRKVLGACCVAAGHAVPAAPFHCTVQLARATWNVRPTRLPDVCRFLQLPLRHHDARSDAEACARIVLAAIDHAQQLTGSACSPAPPGTSPATAGGPATPGR